MIALTDVAVVVKDAKASAKWWKKNLGFETFTFGGAGHAVLVAPPGERFVLHMCEGFAPIEPGNTGIGFATDSMDALLARMKRGSVQFPEPTQKEAWGRRAKFADPDGNVFWLVEAPTPMVRSILRSRAPAPKRAPAKRRAPARRR